MQAPNSGQIESGPVLNPLKPTADKELTELLSSVFPPDSYFMALKGQPAGFEALYAACNAVALKACGFNRLPSESLLEVAHETYLSTYINLTRPDVQTESSSEAYVRFLTELKRTANREAKRILRRKRIEDLYASETAEQRIEQLRREAADAARVHCDRFLPYGAEDDQVARELVEKLSHLIARALDRLNPKYRNLLRDCYELWLSTDELIQLYGYPGPSALYTALSRARHRLGFLILDELRAELDKLPEGRDAERKAIARFIQALGS